MMRVHIGKRSGPEPISDSKNSISCEQSSPALAEAIEGYEGGAALSSLESVAEHFGGSFFSSLVLAGAKEAFAAARAVRPPISTTVG